MDLRAVRLFTVWFGPNGKVQKSTKPTKTWALLMSALNHFGSRLSGCQPWPCQDDENKLRRIFWKSCVSDLSKSLGDSVGTFMHTFPSNHTQLLLKPLMDTHTHSCSSTVMAMCPANKITSVFITTLALDAAIIGRTNTHTHVQEWTASAPALPLA